MQHMLIAHILISGFFLLTGDEMHIIEGMRLVGGDVAYDVVLDS